MGLFNFHLGIFKVWMTKSFSCSYTFLGKIGQHFEEQVDELSVWFDHLEHLTKVNRLEASKCLK